MSRFNQLAVACSLSVFSLLVLAGLASAASPGEPGRVRVLDDFESPLDPNRWQGPAQVSTSHPAHGRGSLKVRFDSTSAILSTTPKDGDWRGFERLIFDVFSPEPLPEILSFRLYDGASGHDAEAAQHDFYRADRKLFLGSGWTHAEVVLKNLEVSSERRPLGLHDIRRLTIAAGARPAPLTLYFDNFRLAAGNESAATASRRAPQDLTTRLEGRSATIVQVGPRDRIPESLRVKSLRRRAEEECQALRTTILSAENMGLDAIYSRAELVTAELGLYFRPLLPWFNNDREKEQMFAYVVEASRRERNRLEKLLTGVLRLPDRDDTQAPQPLVPPYPPLHGLPSRDGFFRDKDGRPLFVISLHGPTGELRRFFATPAQHIESYAVGGGSRWTVDTSPVYEAFKNFPDARRVGWDGWCGHLIRDLHAMGGKKENVVICLESPHIREAVERYIERGVTQWLKNPDLLYNVMAYELQYICYCERSQQMFRAWLEHKYGSVEKVNQVWGTRYTGFLEVSAPPTKQARPLPGTNRAQWYDWASFNQDRFTDYLSWVKGVIRRFDSVTPLAAGGSYSMLRASNGISGIDEEQIVNRVDDVILHEGSGSTLGLDLQIALFEQPKPVCDPEMNLQNVRYLLPHLLHGKSVIQLWHWPEQPPAENPHFLDHSPAHGWSFQLRDLSALFRAVLDARRLSREIAAFPFAPAQVGILYSRTSMLQIPPEMLTWSMTPYLRQLETSYEATRFLDARATFVTENQILRGKLSKLKVFVIPAASHLRAEVVEAVFDFVARGGTLVMLPSSLLSDEYNRPADYLGRVGVQVRRIQEAAADRPSEMEQAYDQSFHEKVVYRSPEVVSLGVRRVGIFAKVPPRLELQGTQQEITVSGEHQTLATFPDARPALVLLKRGRGSIYYSAAGFSDRGLHALLDRIFEAAGVERPVRVRAEEGGPLWGVEARYVEAPVGKLLYIVNFNEHAVSVRIELDEHPAPTLLELRKQERLTGGRARVLAGETLIFRLD